MAKILDIIIEIRGGIKKQKMQGHLKMNNHKTRENGKGRKEREKFMENRKRKRKYIILEREDNQKKEVVRKNNDRRTGSKRKRTSNENYQGVVKGKKSSSPNSSFEQRAKRRRINEKESLTNIFRSKGPIVMEEAKEVTRNWRKGPLSELMRDKMKFMENRDFVLIKGGNHLSEEVWKDSDGNLYGWDGWKIRE